MKDIKTAYFIAFKSVLRGSRSMVLLLIFILSLSFLNMMFISGILSGLQNLIIQATINNFSSHIAISPQQEPQIKQFIQNQNEVHAQLAAIPGIMASTRHYQLAGSVGFDKDKNGVFKSVSGPVLGIDPSVEGKVLHLHEKLLAGLPLAGEDTDQMLLSSALAGGYGIPAPSDLGGVKAGDKVRLTYPNGIIRTYTVKGIYDDSLGVFEIFITAKEAESVLSVYNSASQILVKVDLSRQGVGAYEKEIETLFPKLKIQTYEDLFGGFAPFLNAINLISIIVSSISVVVAGITIFVLIYVNAINKRRQIGILKAIGIRQEIIVLSYVFQSAFFSFFGVIIGSILVFGILTPILAAYPINVAFGNLSLVHTPTAVVASVVSLIAAGFLAGYVPAHIVAREHIVKAIWG